METPESACGTDTRSHARTHNTSLIVHIDDKEVLETLLGDFQCFCYRNFLQKGYQHWVPLVVEPCGTGSLAFLTCKTA